MGAHDYIQVFKTADRSVAEREWKRVVDEDRHESGSGAYAGNATTMHGSITFRDLKLKSEGEAREYILDHHEKWTGPLAVSFMVAAAPGEREKTRVKKALTKFESREGALFETAKAIQTSFAGRASRLVGCEKCGSRLSRTHIVEKLRKGCVSAHPVNLNGVARSKTFTMPELPKCPVCQASLLSETASKRLEAKRAKVEEAKKLHDDARKPRAGGEVAWAVGGWAAS